MATFNSSSPKKINQNNVIKLKVVDGKLSRHDKIKYNKDGSIDKRHSNRIKGVSIEVYPLKTEDEIKAMINVLDTRIDNAKSQWGKKVAYRNKMMFIVGINVGLRASDLIQLKYSFFLGSDGKFKEHYSLQPKKTAKSGKFVKIFFNQATRKAILDYVEKYPIEDMEDYLFASKKGGYICEKTLWNIINELGKEAGIKQNLGSHTLRKTWGFWVWHKANDKNKALVMLQQCFKHSSSTTTLGYIGIMDNEKKDLYESVELGLDFM